MAKKVFLFGLCGQSASGKTTILSELEGKDVSGRKIHILPNAINSVCADPIRRIIAPDEVISEYKNNSKDIQELYDQFLEGQSYLQGEVANKYDVKIHELKADDEPCILLTDRSLIDFYLYTNSGINYLERITEVSSKNADSVLARMRVVTSNMMKVFFDGMAIVYPHGKEIQCECHGRRKTGLEEEYTGTNWYSPIFDINYDKITEINSADINGRCDEVKSAISRGI